MSMRALMALLQDRRSVAILTGIFIAFGLVCIATDYTLHDEGLYTYMMADWTRRAFVPILFWQKSRPVLSLLYLPAAAISFRTMLAVHLAVAATAIPMIAAVARSLGWEFPNFPALILALSPGFLMTAPAGISNSDIVAGLTLALYLLIVRRSSWSCGLVLGMLPWVRNESALFVGTIILVELITRRDFILALGALIFPVFYGVAGSIYHHDLQWLLHFPPVLMQPMPNNPIWQYVTPGRILGALLVLTPAAGVLLLSRPGRWTPRERWLYLAAFGWLVLATVLPIWRIANFGFIPRYYLQTLPFLALMGGRTFEALWNSDKEGRWTWIAPFGFALPATLLMLFIVSHAATGVVVLFVYTATVILLLGGSGRAAALMLVGVVVAGPFLGLPTEVPSRDRWTAFPAIGEWLAANKTEGTPVLTNSPLLAAHLNRPDLDVRFMVGVDHEYEMKELCDIPSGQWEVVKKLSEAEFDATSGMLPERIEPDKVANGTVFVFRDDDRLEMLMPQSKWAAHLKMLKEEGRYRIARFVR